MRRVIRGNFNSRLGFVTLFLSLAMVSCWKVEADLVVSPVELNFGGDKDTLLVSVRNDSEDNALTSGVTVLNYQFKPDKSWVTVSPASGACGGMEKNIHTVAIDRSLLAFGENTTNIKITSNGGSVTIRVLAIKPVPGCSDAPDAPNTPSPAMAAIVSTNTELSWAGGNSRCDELTATYDVYFGTSSSPPYHHNNGSSKTWDPGALANETTYYWKIVAKDANGATAGPVWRFTTVCTSLPDAPCSPSPANSAVLVSRSQNLAWSCGDSDCGLSAMYDVYFGTGSDLGDDDKVGTTSSKAWALPQLDALQTYYWKVVAKDANGTTSSAVWSFTTGF